MHTCFFFFFSFFGDNTVVLVRQTNNLWLHMHCSKTQSESIVQLGHLVCFEFTSLLVSLS